MDSLMDDCSPYSQVSPFRDLRIKGYLLLPEAYRSLSRLSSALSAKASALRPSSLDLCIYLLFFFANLEEDLRASCMAALLLSLMQLCDAPQGFFSQKRSCLLFFLA